MDILFDLSALSFTRKPVLLLSEANHSIMNACLTNDYKLERINSETMAGIVTGQILYPINPMS